MSDHGTLAYAVTLTPIDGAVMVTCDDLPEFTGVGDTDDEAMIEAINGLETTLLMYLQDGRAIPSPSAPARGQHLVIVRADPSKR